MNGLAQRDRRPVPRRLPGRARGAEARQRPCPRRRPRHDRRGLRRAAPRPRHRPRRPPGLGVGERILARGRGHAGRRAARTPISASCSSARPWRRRPSGRRRCGRAVGGGAGPARPVADADARLPRHPAGGARRARHAATGTTWPTSPGHAARGDAAGRRARPDRLRNTLTASPTCCAIGVPRLWPARGSRLDERWAVTGAYLALPRPRFPTATSRASTAPAAPRRSGAGPRASTERLRRGRDAGRAGARPARLRRRAEGRRHQPRAPAPTSRSPAMFARRPAAAPARPSSTEIPESCRCLPSGQDAARDSRLRSSDVREQLAV